MSAGVNMDLKSLARALGGDVRQGQVCAPGPGHSNADRSMSVKLSVGAPDGFIVHSFANDDVNECRDYIRQKIGAEPFKPNGHQRKQASVDEIDAALRAAFKRQEEGPLGKPVANFDYPDDRGTLLYQIRKFEPSPGNKTFRAYRLDGSKWIDGAGDHRVLYRLPELIKCPDGTAFICEGEKDADRIASLGHCGTTVAFGEWEKVDIAALKGRDCLVLEDNDEPGREKAIKAATKLYGAASTIRIVRLPGLREKGDVSDWLDADPLNNTAERLVELCFDAPLWEPTAEQAEQAKAEDKWRRDATRLPDRLRRRANRRLWQR
jgi:hypothetical protein